MTMVPCGGCSTMVETQTCEAPERVPDRSISEIRFNKLPPTDDLDKKFVGDSKDYENGVHKKIFPLMPSDYPLSDSKATRLIAARETLADSTVSLDDDFEVDDDILGIVKDDALQNNKLVYPGDDGYWDELEQVVDMQIARLEGKPPSDYQTWPELWQGWDLTRISAEVRGEYPGFHQQILLGALFSQGIKPHGPGSPPFRSKRDFVGLQVRMAEINTWAFHAVAPINFGLKWSVGMPRPEEMAYLIARNAVKDENNKDFKRIARKIKKIEDMKEKDLADTDDTFRYKATDFTAYTDGKNKGSPTHPSWPAMHSAGSTISTWLPAIVELTGEQYCEALRTDFAVSYGRTVAGVHYQQDNLAGLNIGMKIIQLKLPKYLEEKFGYDASVIERRLNALSFDWNTFDSKACTINGKDAAEHLKNAMVPEMPPGYKNSEKTKSNVKNAKNGNGKIIRNSIKSIGSHLRTVTSVGVVE